MNKRKAFTVVELVIVIAIIAIIAAVLIPTFAAIIKKANDSVFLQDRTSQQINDMAERVLNNNYMTWEDFEKSLMEKLTQGEVNTGNIIALLEGYDDMGLSEEQLTKIFNELIKKNLTDVQVRVILERAGVDESYIEDIISKLPKTAITKDDILKAIEEIGLDTSIKTAVDEVVDDALENVPDEDDIAAIVHKILEQFVQGITVTPTEDEIEIGDTVQLSATTEPSGRTVTWTSSDTAVATVDATGLVTGVAAGSATITATSGTKSAAAVVTVVSAGSVEYHITGVLTYNTVDDHKYNNGDTIGTTKAMQQLFGIANSLDYGITGYSTYVWHMGTVTYTIPDNVPQNATIILDPVDINSRFMDVCEMPGMSNGYTIKIVDNSGHNFHIDSSVFSSGIIDAIRNAAQIIISDGTIYSLDGNGNYVTLPEEYIPYLTQGGLFDDYRKWLKDNSLTAYASVNTNFINQYINELSAGAETSLEYYVETVLGGWSDAILVKLCGQCTGNTTVYRHVESEVVRRMIDFNYRKGLGIAFVQNTYAGWYEGIRGKMNNSNSTAGEDISSSSPVWKDWTEFYPTALSVSSLYGVIDNIGNMLNSTTAEGVTTAGVALVWNAYAGNAWQETFLCEVPGLTITMTAD